MAQPTKSIDLERASSQCFHTADNSELMSDFTLEFWVNFESSPNSTFTFILDKWTGGGSNRDWQIYIDNSPDVLLAQNTSNGASSTTTSGTISSGTIDTATWYHYALVHDLSAGTLDWYSATESTDHTSVGQITGLNTTVHDGSARHDWFSENGSSFTLDGKVHDMRIWSTTRSISELDDNFKNESLSDSATNLVMRLRFEDDLTDSSPSGYDATGVGSPTYSTDIPDWSGSGGGSSAFSQAVVIM